MATITTDTQTGAQVRRLVERYQELATFAARRHYKGWPAFISFEDLEQIALIALWKAAQRAEPGIDHFPQLANCAMNAAIVDQRRKLLGRTDDPDKIAQRAAVISTLELKVGVYDAPTHTGMSYEDRDELARAIRFAKLTDRERIVLGYVMEQWKPAEIATELGISHPLVNRAMRLIAAKLGPMLS